MGMTIDEALVKMQSYKKLMWGTECDKRYGEAFDIAIETMCKYQKITEMIDNIESVIDANQASEDEGWQIWATGAYYVLCQLGLNKGLE